MPINTACTGCGQFLSVADQHVGKQARCPSCGQIYTVPLRSTIDELGNPISISQSSANDSSNPFSFAEEKAPAEKIHEAQLFDDVQPPQVSSSDSYWMQAANGQIYGPVDRNNLDRWFREGRVGADYQIRQGELGPWQPAIQFQPVSTATGYAQPSPFAATGAYNSTQNSAFNPYVAAPMTTQARPAQQSEKGVMVLVFGVLSWVFCFGFGIAAVVVGGQALREIDAGVGHPNERVMLKIGYWLGLISIVMNLIGLATFLFLSALGSIGVVR